MRRPSLARRKELDSTSRQVKLVASVVITVTLFAACADASPGSSSDVPIGVPDAQRTILEDGVVTYGEFESSIYATTRCLEAGGFTIKELSIQVSGWSLSYASPYEDAGDEDAAYKECHDEYMSHVEPTYFSTIESSDDDPVTTAMIACLNDIGIPLDADATWSDIQSMADIDPVGWVQCRSEADSP